MVDPVVPKQTPFQGLPLFILMMGLSSGMFVASWSIAWSIPMLPYIAGAYSTSLDHAVWSLTFYLMAWALGVVPATWVYQRFGEVKTYLFSLSLLMLATLPDVFSNHFSLFLLGRLLQGFCAGLLTPLIRRMLIRFAPSHWQLSVAALSIINIVFPLLAGPSLAGWIAYNWDWRGAPMLTFPLGFFSLTVLILLVRDDITERSQQPFDWVGWVLLGCWSAIFQIVLNRGEDWNWWDSMRIRWLVALGFVSLLAFWVWEREHPYPCLDLRLLKRRNFVLAIPGLIFGWGFLLGGNSLFVSGLIGQAGYSAFWAGIVLLPMAIAGVPLIAVMGPLSHRINPLWLATVCFLLIAVYGFSTQVNQHSSLESLILCHFLEGAALGFYLVPLSLIMFSRLPAHRLPAASTLQNFVRILGGAYLSSGFSALWMRHSDYFRAHLAWQSPQDPLMALRNHLLAKEIPGKQVDALTLQHLLLQSGALSMQSMLHLWGWMALLVLIPLWFSKGPYRRRPNRETRVTIEEETMENAGFNDQEPNDYQKKQ